MDSAYDPGAWHDFYLMLGGSAAALTGLVFVAVSLHLEAVLRSPWRRGSAASSLLALTSVVFISGAVLLPSQSPPALGAEVAAIALVNPLYSAKGVLRLPEARRRAVMPELVIGWLAGLVSVAAGVSLAVQAGGGLWLLLPGAAVALGSAIRNAWQLMVAVAEEGG